MQMQYTFFGDVRLDPISNYVPDENRDVVRPENLEGEGASYNVGAKHLEGSSKGGAKIWGSGMYACSTMSEKPCQRDHVRDTMSVS